MSIQFFVNKLRNKGFVWCFRKGVGRIYKLLTYLIPASRYLLQPLAKSQKRILAIWDFRTSVYSVGDSINLHEATLIWRELYQLDKVDICFLCDPKRPARDDVTKALGITPDNYHGYLAEIVSLAQMNPHLGAILLFDSPRHLERYILDNVDRYPMIWPSGVDYFTQIGAYGKNFDLVQHFYRTHGYLPGPPIRSQLLAWARYFLKKYVRSNIPVVVHVRNVKTVERDLSRNVEIDIWLEFFKYCETRYPITFVVICSRNEIDPQLRGRKNVLIAKDFDTTIVQDLALIPVAAMYMSAPSGPAQLAMFSDVPYIITNYKPSNETLEPNKDLIFATPLQKLIWEPATIHMLIRLFSDIFAKINLEKWKADFLTNAPEHDPLMARACQLK